MSGKGLTARTLATPSHCVCGNIGFEDFKKMIPSNLIFFYSRSSLLKSLGAYRVTLKLGV